MRIATDFATVKKIFLGIGASALGASVYMTWKFGYSISLAHAIALVSVTLAAAFVFPARKFIADLGFKGAARVVGLLGAFFVSSEFISDLGYTFGMRDKQVIEAGAQNASYAATHTALKSEQTNLDLWRKQLADLQAQNAWATTITADGLRAQLESAQKAIDLEAQRGGCKAKCLDRMKEKAQIEEKIAVAEQVTNLAKRIEATQRVIDSKTETAVNTKVGHSTTKAQSNAFAKVGLLLTGTDARDSLNPDEVSMTLADLFIGLMMAVGATALPTLCFYIAFFGHQDPQRPFDVDAMAKARCYEAVEAPLKPYIQPRTDGSFDALRRWVQSPEAQRYLGTA
mgnify:CR=1 FL=1